MYRITIDIDEFHDDPQAGPIHARHVETIHCGEFDTAGAATQAAQAALAAISLWRAIARGDDQPRRHGGTQ